MKSLVICADDYALSEPISLAIETLAKNKRISATSVMSLSPLWPSHSASLQSLKGQIDVGLHLDWTSEFAIANGHGGSLNSVMLKSLLGQNSIADCKKIIHQQLDWFEKYWAQAPSHIDGHQHIHQFSGIRQALIEVILERYLFSYKNANVPMPYLRISRAIKPQNTFKAQIIALMGAGPLLKSASQNNILSLPYLSGIYDLKIGPISYPQRMENWLKQTTPIQDSILMCHPSLLLEEQDTISAARVQEFQYLNSQDFLDHLNQYQVTVDKAELSFKINPI